MWLVAALLAVLLVTSGCKQPDTFGGCSQHPGQCDQTRR